MPLAARMRPERLEDVIGQSKLLEEGTPLRRVIENKDAASTSLILWGPPGVGKTTLARLIATSRGSAFRQLSAISAGVKEVREVVDEAKKNALYGSKTVLFLDEIHRFTKSQQDSLLPSVEAGDVQLVAA
ncbi:MAG: AAA family ATPase, partial [Actinobacteria bacterium]|nr:AAA family ATPase [Actinomycetota bacterium]